MEVKALVVDMDGTLYGRRKVKRVTVMSINRTHEYLAKILSPDKVPTETMKDVDSMMRNTGQVSMCIRLLSEKYGLDYETFDDYVNNHDPKKVGIKRNEKLVSLFSDLSKRHKIFLFSNAPTVWTSSVISSLGLDRFIRPSRIVNGNTLGEHLKPQAAAFRIMLKKTGLRKNDILFLDDNQDNISTARRLGIKAIRVINDGTRNRYSIYGILEGIQYKDRMRNSE